jgi:hypothetical protein
MLATKLRPHFSGDVREAVSTSADQGAPVTRQSRQEWQKLIENRLVEWRCNPSQLDEEGTVTLSRATIQLAIDLASQMSKDGLLAPTRIVPDVNGGMVFERQRKDLFETLRISADGSVEHRVFENCRLVHRERWLVQLPDSP